VIYEKRNYPKTLSKMMSTFLNYLFSSEVSRKITANVSRLGEGGDNHHPPRRIDAENQTLINHKCVCGALSRHFCQTLVSGFFSVVII
jgi:hypothetical protein